MKDQLLEVINEMMEESGRPSFTELKGDMSLRDDLGMDSLMLAELTVRIEDLFHVDLFEDGSVHTIDEVIARIKM